MAILAYRDAIPSRTAVATMGGDARCMFGRLVDAGLERTLNSRSRPRAGWAEGVWSIGLFRDGSSSGGVLASFPRWRHERRPLGVE